MSKGTHTLTIDNNVWNQAREKKINISGFVEEKLKELIGETSEISPFKTCLLCKKVHNWDRLKIFMGLIKDSVFIDYNGKLEDQNMYSIILCEDCLNQIKANPMDHYIFFEEKNKDNKNLNNLLITLIRFTLRIFTKEEEKLYEERKKLRKEIDNLNILPSKILKMIVDMIIKQRQPYWKYEEGIIIHPTSNQMDILQPTYFPNFNKEAVKKSIEENPNWMYED